MVRRSERSAAFPAIYVFPGGTVDAGDAEIARTALLRHVVPALAEREPSEPAHEVAAIREAFEEAGMLLAAGPDGAPLDESVDLRSVRAEALSGTRSFADVLAGMGAMLDARRLWYFSHWITPLGRSRRFDTHFYLAEAPEGQAGSTDDFETLDGIWIAPAEALRRNRAGDFPMIFPTIKHLERLAAYDTVEALRAFATTKPIHTVLPNSEDKPRMPDGLEGKW